MQLPRANFESSCLKKLDSLDWKFGFCVDFDGSLLGVRCDCEETGEKLLSVAQEHGSITDGAICDSLISVKKAAPSKRRGVRHRNILYSNHVPLKKSFELDDVFVVYQDFLKLAAITMTDHLVHIDASRPFAWEADDRLISVVGPNSACRIVVGGLRPHLMPETTSFTSISANGTHPFAPLDRNWRGRTIHQPLPITDLVFLLEDGQSPVSQGEAVLRLYELSSGKLPAESRISVLASALKRIRIHSVLIEDKRSLAQRFSDIVGLGATARELSDEFLYAED